MITILAYGGFSGDEVKDLWKIISFITPYMLTIWGFCLGSYFTFKKRKYLMPIIIPAYLVFVYFYAPTISATGSYGPRHIGCELILASLGLSVFFMMFSPIFILFDNQLKKEKAEQ